MIATSGSADVRSRHRSDESWTENVGPQYQPRPAASGIVLYGLPALYAHGLLQALVSAGVGPVARADGNPADVLARSGRLIIVIPPDEPQRWYRLVDQLARSGDVTFVELTADEGVDSFASALRRGAVGVLPPGAELELAVEVLRSAAAGLVVLPERIARAIHQPSAATPPPPLQPRERQWLRKLGTGTTVSALAESAAYSEREMYRLLSKLYTRLGAANRTEALLRAERWGMLDD